MSGPEASTHSGEAVEFSLALQRLLGFLNVARASALAPPEQITLHHRSPGPSVSVLLAPVGSGVRDHIYNSTVKISNNINKMGMRIPKYTSQKAFTAPLPIWHQNDFSDCATEFLASQNILQR